MWIGREDEQYLKPLLTCLQHLVYNQTSNLKFEKFDKSLLIFFILWAITWRTPEMEKEWANIKMAKFEAPDFHKI